jgi:beta-phosphoglucomutase-like phosphatase (HAD superfamily)
MSLDTGGDGLFQSGRDGVLRILTPFDRKVDFLVYEDKTLCYVKSDMGHPAIYPVPETSFAGPADTVLMDLDGTSVHSEGFWIWIIEQSCARLLDRPGFSFKDADLPYVSGHSVSEHLRYCIREYCPEKTVEEARRHYFAITEFEMEEILHGRGRVDAFTPAPGLKEFLLSLKDAGIRIGLVTSGLYQKAWPEVLSAFRTLGLGDPLDFYDIVITAGSALRKGQTGTLGELSPKPHPWLYADTARIGLGIDASKRSRVLGVEDSSAGIVSVCLAGFSAAGISGGTIDAGGTGFLCTRRCDRLEELLPYLLGR